VASLVLEHGGNETEAIAALLHDCIEDCGSQHSTYIREAFGGEVLSIVKACSDAEVEQDEKKPDWRERKVGYIRHLGTQPGSVLLVSGCDKLHNARAILSDVRYSGQSVWERFSKGEAEQLWYYRTLADTFKARVPAVAGGDVPWSGVNRS
jgi:(p)ppGpp synthase/HD superfamily hydrolase